MSGEVSVTVLQGLFQVTGFETQRLHTYQIRLFITKTGDKSQITVINHYKMHGKISRIPTTMNI